MKAKLIWTTAIILLFISSVFVGSRDAAAVNPTAPPLLLSDGEFVYGQNMADFDLEVYLQTRAHHLLPYRQDIYAVAIRFSINPRVLLTLMEMKTGVVTNTQAPEETIEDPFGLGNATFIDQLYEVSAQLEEGFYFHFYEVTPLQPDVRPALPAFEHDSTRRAVPSTTNAGTYAVASAVDRYFSEREINVVLRAGHPDGFVQTYLQLFSGDNPLDTSTVLPRPDDDTPDTLPYLQLPFPVGEEWKFNGVHGTQGTNPPFNSIDFSRNFEAPGHDASKDWIVAAAPGTPSYTGGSGYEGCQISIAHDDEGTRTVYLHLENWDENLPDPVPSNYRLGNPANTYSEATCGFPNASWSAVHGHFTLHYQGVRWPLAGEGNLNGVSLSDWTINYSGNTAYGCSTTFTKGFAIHHAWCHNYAGDRVRNDAGVGQPAVLILDLDTIMKHRPVTLHLTRSTDEGREPPFKTAVAETDANGVATFTLEGVAHDTYDLFVKPEGWLVKRERNLQLQPGNNYLTLDFTPPGNWIGGDIDEDNMVGLTDFSIWIFEWDYGIDLSKTQNARLADLNGDGNVDLLDYNIVFNSWGNFGDVIPGQSQTTIGTDFNKSQGNEGALSLTLTGSNFDNNQSTPQKVNAIVGDVLNLDLGYDTAGLGMSGVDFIIDFDPCVVNPLTDLIAHSGVFDDAFFISQEGTLIYQANKWEGLVQGNPVYGSGLLATIPFEIVGSVQGTSNINIRHTLQETADSNMVLDGTANDFLGNVYGIELHTEGDPPRPLINAEITSPNSGDSFGGERIILGLDANDPCGNINRAEFEFLPLETPNEVNVSTIAGSAGETGISDGFGSFARFNTPWGIDVDQASTFAVVADTFNNTIRMVDLRTNEVTTLAGLAGVAGSSDGFGSQARFDAPYFISISPNNDIALITDHYNHTIRQVELESREVSTLAGLAGITGSQDGIGANARFRFPSGIAISYDGSYALIADKSNHTIRRIDLATTEVNTIAGLAGVSGSQDGVGSTARFNFPQGISISPDGQYALVADGSNNTIRRIDLDTSEVTTMAGLAGIPGSQDGIGNNARFRNPHDVDIYTGYGFVADTDNHTIRVIDLVSTQVTTIAGLAENNGSSDGEGGTARFYWPTSVSLAADFGKAFVADSFNSTIRELSFWEAVGVDPDGTDSWSIAWGIDAYEDQTVQLRAYAGDYAGNGTETPIVDNFIIDHTLPQFLSVSYDPVDAFQGQSVYVTLHTSDNLAGIERIDFYVDPSAGELGPWIQWKHVGALFSPTDTLVWDTNGFGAGRHATTIIIRDRAGNTYHASSESYPSLAYVLQPGWAEYLPILAK